MASMCLASAAQTIYLKEWRGQMDSILVALKHFVSPSYMHLLVWCWFFKWCVWLGNVKAWIVLWLVLKIWLVCLYTLFYAVLWLLETTHNTIIFKKRGWHWQPGTERGQRILREKYLSCLWIAERGWVTGTERVGNLLQIWERGVGEKSACVGGICTKLVRFGIEIARSREDIVGL